jgi:AcrR family transcriptional regulator
MGSATARHDRERPLRRDAELNRRRILAAATEVFAGRGLDASLDDIARHAGLGVGTVYRRFPNKEALVEALFEERMEQISLVAREALAEPDSWVALTTFIERSAELVIRDRGLRDMLAGTAYAREKIAKARDRIQPNADALVSRAKADGYLRADYDTTDGQVILIMLAHAADYCQPVRPDAWRRYMTFMIDGLRATRDGATPLPAAQLDQDEADEIMKSWGWPRRPVTSSR